MKTEENISLDNQTTIPALFRFRAQTLKNKVAMREKHLGIWRAFSWNQYYFNSARLGKAMMMLGMESGQTVSILADPCKEWLFSTLLLNVLVVFLVVSMRQIRPPKSFIFVKIVIQRY